MNDNQNSRKHTHKKLKRSSIMYRAYAGMLLILAITFISGFFYTSAFAKDDTTQPVYKYYTGLEVKCGDTLWSIANRYADEEYISVQDYIEELKYINNMTSDKLVEGHYLTIAYFSSEYK